MNNYHSENIIGLSKSTYKLHQYANVVLSKKKTFFNKVCLYFLKKTNRLFNLFLGCHIPFKTKIGKRLVLPHGFHGIFISKHAEIGNDCCIFHQVTIGSNFHTSIDPGAPIIGNNVFIGVGAKIIGKIKIGDNVKIGANAIVVKDVEDGKTIVSPKAIII